MANDQLLTMARPWCAAPANEPLAHPALENWLVTPGLGTQSGLLGAVALAEQALG